MYWDQRSISCEQRIWIWLTVDDPSPPLCQRLPKATKRVDNLWYMNQEVTRGYVVFHILHKCFHITNNNTISSWVFFQSENLGHISNSYHIILKKKIPILPINHVLNFETHTTSLLPLENPSPSRTENLCSQLLP